MMRKITKIMIYTLPLLVLAVLCSCGVQEEGGQIQKKETAEMVEGVSTAVFKNSETTEKTDYLANDYIRVWENYDTYTWMQENLDGTERKPMEKAGLTLGDEYSYRVEWLTNDWVYLAVWDEVKEGDLPDPDANPQYTFCRVPLQGGEEVVYDVANKEDLFQLDMETDGDANTVSEFVVTDSYILYSYFYSYDDPHGRECYCYDFNTKKTSLAFSVDELLIIGWQDALPITLNNCFFLQAGDEIYSIDFDTFEKTKIAPDPKDIAADREFLDNLKNRESLKNLEEIEDLEYDYDHGFCRMTVQDGKLYFNGGYGGYSQIYQYDGNSVSCVIDEDILVDNLASLKVADTGYISDIYTWKGRLYIHIHGFYDSGKGRTVDILVSTDLSDLKQWTLEEEFMEYAGKKNYDMISGFVHGKSVFSMWVDNDEKYFAYDLETKKIEAVSDPMYIW